MRRGPTAAPPGRLVRLGVVLRGERAAPLARMCDRVGMDAVWLVDPAPALVSDVLTATERCAVGVVAATAAPAVTASLPEGPAAAGRLEVTVADPAHLADLAGRGWRLSLEWRPGVALDAVAGLPDDLALRPGPGEADALVAAAAPALAGRRLGLALALPASIGRTEAEARARAPLVPPAAGPPDRGGLFGTLERCQDRVLALAHAGVTDLRCEIPDAPDAHDVIAQLWATAAGSLAALPPGAARSKPPDPPPGWGGRSSPR